MSMCKKRNRTWRMNVQLEESHVHRPQGKKIKFSKRTIYGTPRTIPMERIFLSNYHVFF